MKKNRVIVLGLIAIGAVTGMGLAGCASAPAVFEGSGSLAGTHWEHSSKMVTSSGTKGGGKLVFNDETSGVYTNADGQESPVTYTAVFNAEARTFTGTIKQEGGGEAPLTAKTGGFGGWSLKAEGLFDNLPFKYVSPEVLALRAAADEKAAAFNAQYGEPYSGIFKQLNEGVPHALMQKTLKRDDGKQIGIVGPEFGFVDGGKVSSFHPYIFHSKDGETVIIEPKSIGNMGNASGEVAGTFKYRIDKKETGGTYTETGSPVYSFILTISDGTGLGEQLNGVWVDD
jgi:hypothetical protein